MRYQAQYATRRPRDSNDSGNERQILDANSGIGGLAVEESSPPVTNHHLYGENRREEIRKDDCNKNDNNLKNMYSKRDNGLQDDNNGKEKAPEKLSDDEEYRILVTEIERIYRSSMNDGILSPDDNARAICLTSVFSNEDKISDSMNEKLMRLIKAMMPNSTTEQKEGFVRDLFDMGIRVIRKKMQPEMSGINLGSVSRKIRQTIKKLESRDDSKVDESSYIVESVDESETTIESINSQCSSNKQGVTKQEAYRCEQRNNYLDEADNRGEQLTGKALKNGIEKKNGCEEISLTSEMKEDLIQDCVETGMPSLHSARLRCKDQDEQRECVSEGDSALSQIRHNIQRHKMEQRSGKADESSIHKPIQRQAQSGTKIMPNFVTIHNELKAVTNTPSFDEGDNNEQNVLTSRHNEEFADLNNRYLVKESTQKKSTFQGKSPTSVTRIRAKLTKVGSPKSTKANSQPIELQCGLYSKVTEQKVDVPKKVETSNTEEVEISLIPSAKDKASKMETRRDSISDEELRSKDEQYLEINTDNDLQGDDDTINDSTVIGEDERYTINMINSSDEINELERVVAELNNESTRSIGKENDLIQVESSLTSGTDLSFHKKDNKMTSKKRSIPSLRISTNSSELEWSHFEPIDLSVGETIGKSFSFTSNDSESGVSSWRLNPCESLSDFTLLILSTATGETTNYHVHKHMMAVGPRRSGYMDELFCSENTSTFQMTLDGKTAVLIPKILDFVYCGDYDMNITTSDAVPLRQLGKMLKIVPLEIKAAAFIIEDMEISNISAYVSDCCFYKDEQVTKSVVQKCSANIGTVPVDDRLWIVMDPEIFLRVITSPHIERDTLSMHLSIILREYLELHQYQINVDLFTTLTSEEIIPSVDRDAALPLIELCEFYDSDKCETLQKRCAYTIACYWKTTAQNDRRKLFSLLRNLPSSFTVDFLEIVESGRSEIPEESKRKVGDRKNDDVQAIVSKPEIITIRDLCEGSVWEDWNASQTDEEILSWRLDPGKSYSDWAIQINNLDHQETQVYHMHKHIIAVGLYRSHFFGHYFDSDKIAAREKGSTTVELDHEAASVVPQVLDFIYSRGHEMDISDKNVLAMHYVARVLGISMLSKFAVDFISKNMTLDNVSSFIVQANSFKDYKTIAMASRLCARDIISIKTDSELLKALEPEFFEMVVASDEIDERAKCHVIVLITQYFSLHNLDEDVVEKLLKYIDVNQINHLSALKLLKILGELNEHKGIKIFDKMKKHCAKVMTANWTELTENYREEMFSILPNLDPELITRMFDTVDNNYRIEYNESMSLQSVLVKRYRTQVVEANRLREEEVSNLKKELEERTAQMVLVQKAMESKLIQVEQSLNRRTVRSTAAFVNARSPRKSRPQPEKPQEVNVAKNDDSVPETDTKKAGIEIDCYQDKKDESKQQNVVREEPLQNGGKEEIKPDQSVSTAKVQAKKGSLDCCDDLD